MSSKIRTPEARVGIINIEKLEKYEITKQLRKNTKP